MMHGQKNIKLYIIEFWASVKDASHYSTICI